MKKTLFLALFAAAAFSSAASGAEKMSVFVSILPQKYFAEQIAGERADVWAMVEKGRDPHTFEPLPAQMKALSKARGYFSIGLPFEESLLPRAQQLNPDLQVFPTDKGIDKIQEGHHNAHNKDEDHNHEHDGADPHVWNGPGEVKIIAENIFTGLITLDPEGEEIYSQNLHNFLTHLNALNNELKELFQDQHGAAFLVFHPAWGYLAREYDLEEVAIEVDGKEPKATDMAGIISKAKERGVKVIFISPQFSKKSAETIAGAIGASVETVNPLAEEWEDNIRAVAKAIAEAAK